jgi:hypothetical protein
MFEPRHKPLLPKHLFLRRVSRSLAVAMLMLCLSLLIGMWGYHYFESMSWLDAYLNAAMILSGMGPMHELTTPQGKFFAGSYALFSGIIFLVIMAIILAPAVHRFFHKFHVDEDKKS